MTSLHDLLGTTWIGAAELWLDPLGDSADRSDCTLSIVDKGVRYTWHYDGEKHRGEITLGDDGATFIDTWHQPEAMDCVVLSDHGSLLQIRGAYGPDADWGWRIMLSWRQATDELVLQMTNIAPWGEEARAVRMVGTRQ